MTSGSEDVTGPLAGVRVLDLSSVLMGPAATRTLGDLGADVIFVEPAKGDRNRTMGSGPAEGFSCISLNLLRNKRSISIDLKHPRGHQAFLDIAATCDVMITNLRPGPLRRLGLHYEADPECNRQGLEALSAHAAAITAALGPTVEGEEWTKHWTRIHENVQLAPLSQAYAAAVAERIAAFINVLEPLRQAGLR